MAQGSNKLLECLHELRSVNSAATADLDHVEMVVDSIYNNLTSSSPVMNFVNIFEGGLKLPTTRLSSSIS